MHPPARGHSLSQRDLHLRPGMTFAMVCMTFNTVHIYAMQSVTQTMHLMAPPADTLPTGTHMRYLTICTQATIATTCMPRAP